MQDLGSTDKEWGIKFTDIPLGTWDLQGRWWPNFHLEMSEAEQRRHNMIGGHYKNQYNPDDFTTVWSYVDPEPTMLDKVLGWFRKHG